MPEQVSNSNSNLFVTSILYTESSENVKESVEKDLKKEDPSEVAIAELLEENIRKD